MLAECFFREGLELLGCMQSKEECVGDMALILRGYLLGKCSSEMMMAAHDIDETYHSVIILILNLAFTGDFSTVVVHMEVD